MPVYRNLGSRANNLLDSSRRTQSSEFVLKSRNYQVLACQVIKASTALSWPYELSSSDDELAIIFKKLSCYTFSKALETSFIE